MPPDDRLIQPRAVLGYGRYSPAFERIWQQLADPAIAARSYLDGTEQTIAQLLEPAWEINDCARCGLPIPMKTQGLPCLSCPCSDLHSLPDVEALPPREPIDSQVVLQHLCQRLQELGLKTS
jgi:hypothetical protein